MLAVELDSSNLPTGTYGYAQAVTSTTVRVTWATGTVDTSSTIRYCVPVRAGDTIKVRNDIANIDSTTLVTQMTYEEGQGVTRTRYDLVGADTNKEGGSGKSSIVSRTSDAVATQEGIPEGVELSSDANITTSCVFSAPSASQVNWAAGNLYVGADKYTIDGGNTSSLEALNSDGRVYFVYYVKGDTTFRVLAKSNYPAFVAKRKDSDIRVIAHVNYDLPLARFTLVGIKGGEKNSSIVSTSGNIDAVYGGNGTNAAPTYSFASDTDLGMYSSGAGSLRFTSGGYHAASINATSATDGTIWAYKTYSFIGDTDTSIHNAGANQIGFYTGGGLRGRFYDSGLILDQLGSGSGTALVHDGSNIVLSSTSSKKYKRNIVDIALDSNKVDKLRPVDFEWNENSAMEGVKDIGLIAEEVHEIFPEIVNYKDNKPESVSYDKLSVILLMEIKKLKEEIEKLKENN